MSGTAVTVQSGAQTRWANIFAGGFVVVIIFLLVDLVLLVPMAGLGGLLLVVGFQNIQPEAIRSVWAAGRPARIAMGSTFVATIFLPLQFAILIGVALSFLLQIFRMSNRIELLEIELVEGGFPVERPVPAALGSDEVRVLRVQGALFFASAQAFEAQLPAVEGAARTTVILMLRDIDDLGSTVIRVLKRYATSLQQHGGSFILAGVSEELFGQLQRTGVTDLIGAGNIVRARPELGAALNEAITSARSRTVGATSSSDGREMP